jgi:hypothetical protein
MWGEDGPYSQVNVIEQIRILDGGVSRIFLVVEAEINPFTFECAAKHRKHFLSDEPVLQLLAHAENRGKFGYVVSAGEVELQGDESRAWARRQADMVVQTIIRLHSFVMDMYDLNDRGPVGVMFDKDASDIQYVWNESLGRPEIVGGGLWDAKTLITSPAGIHHGKVRFFIAFAFTKDFDHKRKTITAISDSINRVSVRFNAEIEGVESFQEYMLVVALLSLEVAPAMYAESVLKECEVIARKPIFQKDYLVTNVKRPTQDQVVSFLRMLPLDRDSRMP